MKGVYLLDTNHLGDAIRGVSHFRERIHQSIRSGLRFGSCIPVLCELEAGIQQTNSPSDYRRRLKDLLNKVRLWPLDLEVARIYGEIYLDLERRGRVLSQVDMLLAALALRMDVTLLTTD